MIVGASEHYPHFGVFILSHMCPNVLSTWSLNTLAFAILPWDLN